MQVLGHPFVALGIPVVNFRLCWLLNNGDRAPANSCLRHLLNPDTLHRCRCLCILILADLDRVQQLIDPCIETLFQRFSLPGQRHFLRDLEFLRFSEVF